MLHKKRVLPLIPLIPVIIVFGMYGVARKCIVFPNDVISYDMSTYCDGGEGGNTTITEAVIEPATVSFSYTLKEGAPFPYAGISIGLMIEGNFLDLSKYDYLTLHLESDNTESFAVYLKSFIDGFSKLDEQFTHEFLMKEVSVDTASAIYRIPFDEFIHPPWWLEQSKITEVKIGKPHVSKTIGFQVQNGLLTPFNMPVTVTIKEISFGRDTRRVYGILVFAVILYYLLYLIVFKLGESKQRAKQVVISYKELVVENDADEDMRRIKDCVARNFSEPAFSVEKLAREAGVSASRIPGMLKKKFKLNFKQYLNTIRIHEAKRLLRETDNQIVTLAYTVGYNNIPHFNRTFKQFEGISPKEYRKKNKSEETNQKL